MNLKQITSKDQVELKKVYFDSIQSINKAIYSKEQKMAWASQAWENPNFIKTIINGKGWLISDKEKIIAFASRFPKNKISLFYCRGKYQRQGYGARLLNKIEDEAIKEDLEFLSTEASLLSFRLFLKHNWQIERKEKIIINNIIFERYKMIKILNR